MQRTRLNKFNFIFVFLIFLVFELYTDEKENLTLLLNLGQAKDQLTNNSDKLSDIILTTNEIKSFGLILISFYQAFISTQDSSSCSFSPTCSEFARQALAKYGFIFGVILTADRFQRCNGFGIYAYPYLKDLNSYLDPVEWNLP